jgi:type IV pilus assembly protein PilC
MAVAKSSLKAIKQVAEIPFVWEGTDKQGRKIKGEMLAAGEAVVRQTLRRQGITVSKVRKQGFLSGARKITEKDIALFTRQLSTMVRAGVPLLQSFDITSRSHANPALQRLLGAIKTDVESGSSLNQAFRRHPKYFDDLYCNLVEAGEQAGILETVLDRIASYKEKILAIKGKIKSALMYPVIVIVIALVITAGIMIFVIPVFKQLYESSGAELPALTQLVIHISDMFKSWGGAVVFLVLVGGAITFGQMMRRSKVFKDRVEALSLKIPVFGPLIEKATVARWSRTFASLFAAGVPMVEALESVAGASGNSVFEQATLKLRTDIATGASLTSSLQGGKVFPNMLIQMVSIGEESGSLDSMVEKVADYYEREVDDAVAGISSLMEPIIMVILGSLIGTIVIAMYLPIFKMGSAF